MRKIEFRAGYYEWLAYVGNKLLFVEQDTDWDDLFTNEEELKEYIDTYIMDYYDNVARGILEADNKCFNAKLWLSLKDNECCALKEAIYNAWLRYC